MRRRRPFQPPSSIPHKTRASPHPLPTATKGEGNPKKGPPTCCHPAGAPAPAGHGCVIPPRKTWPNPLAAAAACMQSRAQPRRLLHEEAHLAGQGGPHAQVVPPGGDLAGVAAAGGHVPGGALGVILGRQQPIVRRVHQQAAVPGLAGAAQEGHTAARIDLAQRLQVAVRAPARGRRGVVSCGLLLLLRWANLDKTPIQPQHIMTALWLRVADGAAPYLCMLMCQAHIGRQLQWSYPVPEVKEQTATACSRMGAGRCAPVRVRAPVEVLHQRVGCPCRARGRRHPQPGGVGRW